MGQTPAAGPPPRVDLSEGQLTDGLLELIKPKAPAGSTPQGKVAPMRGEPNSRKQPEERLIEQAKHGMNSVALQLQKGQVDATTKQLGQNVLSQLDELIGKMDRTKEQNSSSNSFSEKATAKPEVKSDSQAGPKKISPSTDRSEQRQNSAESSTAVEMGAADKPGEQGPRVDSRVQTLARQLQQDVWGHLPEKLRTQMNGRMVEDFLPAYREQIQQYYRRLMESGQPGQTSVLRAGSEEKKP
jgi:hypothetical protein